MCPICEKPAMGGKTHPYCKNKYTLDGLISFFHYKGIIKTAIKNVKYQFVSDIAKTLMEQVFLSHRLLEKYPFLKGTTLVPIPLYPTKYRFRGFNQAELFATKLSQIYALPYRNDIIQRIKSTLPQVEMKHKRDRVENMRGVFAIKTKKTLPASIILVDDVFTTGATMREAGRVLKQQGVLNVWGITIAR